MKTKSSYKHRLTNRINQITRLFCSDKRKPQPGDIYIASYPRSGNTWIRYLLANLLESSIEWGIENLNRVIPDIHQQWPKNWITRNPRILKTHHPYQPGYHKAIYIYRDGRDVALSYYDFVIKIGSYSGTFDQFLSDYLDGLVWFGAWHNHLISWLTYKPGVNVLSVRYENLVKDPTADLQRICEFLELSYTIETIKEAITKSSYQHIKHDYQSLNLNLLRHMGTPGIKGGPGKWTEVFTQEQLDRYWSVAGETATKYGYAKNFNASNSF